MCTVTFWPRDRGVLLAMNRDEQRTRAPGREPAVVRHASGLALQPSEAGDGTWISVNDQGVVYALLNWYACPGRAVPSPESRGRVIPAVVSAGDQASARAAMEGRDWSRTRPFRLVGVFVREVAILEWRWDQVRLAVEEHPWRAMQWASSGFDEPRAQRVRGEGFARALSAPDAGTVAWMRRLHAGHEPVQGPYSVCMHRAEAVTVSGTEVEMDAGGAIMRHAAGSPCVAQEWSSLRLELVPGLGLA